MDEDLLFSREVHCVDHRDMMCNIRDSYTKCDGLTCDAINDLHWICVHIKFLCFTIINIVINTCTILILHNCITMCE